MNSLTPPLHWFGLFVTTKHLGETFYKGPREETKKRHTKGVLVKTMQSTSAADPETHTNAYFASRSVY